MIGRCKCQRLACQGVTERDTVSGNLLRREVAAEDVAREFLHQALELKTTPTVTTVGCGNVAANGGKHSYWEM